MIDLHSHILPGVDDGAWNLEEATAMCRAAADAGCDALVATPHQRHDAWPNDDPAVLEGLLGTLRQAVGPRPRLALGAEIRIDSELVAELDARPGSGLLPLAGSRYLLLELDRRGFGPDPVLVVQDVLDRGYVPIFAHPELTPPLAEDLDLAAHLVELGALLQITAMSVCGEFGRDVEERTHALLDAGLAHFVASDCHDLEQRPPGLAAAYETIATGWDRGLAWRLTTANPAAVLANRSLAGPAPAPPPEHAAKASPGDTVKRVNES